MKIHCQPQRWNRWKFGMEKKCHPILYLASDYLSMLEIMVTQVGEKGPKILPKSQLPLSYRCWEIRRNAKRYILCFLRVSPTFAGMINRISENQIKKHFKWKKHNKKTTCEQQLFTYGIFLKPHSVKTHKQGYKLTPALGCTSGLYSNVSEEIGQRKLCYFYPRAICSFWLPQNHSQASTKTLYFLFLCYGIFH